MTDQLCPLCDSPAIFEVSSGPHCKHFQCPVCASYFIDASSEKHIAGLPEVTKSEFRKKLSKGAMSCDADHVYVIRAPRNDELGGDGRSVARTQMIAEYLSRHLPLAGG
jgi:hypothetical protein